ncbi:hypothetical protein [Massilia consociata]|uniref:Uncharacterized protein n=1 Tax=Massilia consociata TaxID=760117 RepID=A0ABV6FCL6_9BURK
MHENTDPAYARARARAIVRSTGILVCALGLAQLVLGLASAPKGTFRFELLGLIVGLLILFGNMRALALVRWLALFAVGASLLELLKPVILMPFDLIVTQLRLFPGQTAMLYLPHLLGALAVLLVAVRLSHPQVLSARAVAGLKAPATRLPLALGIVLALGVCFLQYRALNGEDAGRARQLAADKFGPRYQYHTQYLHIQFGENAGVSATVHAWNDKEVLRIPVQWRR